jgi:hypothetical protein
MHLHSSFARLFFIRNDGQFGSCKLLSSLCLEVIDTQA